MLEHSVVWVDWEGVKFGKFEQFWVLGAKERTTEDSAKGRARSFARRVSDRWVRSSRRVETIIARPPRIRVARRLLALSPASSPSSALLWDEAGGGGGVARRYVSACVARHFAGNTMRMSMSITTESSDSGHHENQRLHKSQDAKHEVDETVFINPCIAL